MTKNKSRPILLLATGLLWAGLAQAQESVNASGGDATGSGGIVAYSIGQAVCNAPKTGKFTKWGRLQKRGSLPYWRVL